MKLKIFFVMGVSLLLFACHGSKEKSVDLKGQIISFSDPHYHLTFLHYWAKWCAVCKKEMPVFNHFSKEQAQKKIRVLGIHFDPIKPDELAAIAFKMPINFPLLTQNPDFIFETSQLRGLPTTLVLNQKGKILEILTGPQTEASLKKIVQKYP